MAELGDSLERMSFLQLLLLFGFVTSYVLALGGLFDSTVRLRAAALALLQAVAFAALTDPWVHGALLMVFVVAGLGLFVMVSWMLARLLGPRPSPQASDSAMEATMAAATETAAETTTLPALAQPSRPADAATAPKLARRAAR